jgi:hypothetical protein
MLNDGLLSVLNGELILHGIEVISGNTVVKTSVSEYFSKISVLLILEEVLPIIIRLSFRRVRRNGRGQLQLPNSLLNG